MGEYGPATTLVDRLIAHASTMTMEEAVDLYRARAARLIVQGPDAERRAGCEHGGDVTSFCRPVQYRSDGSHARSGPRRRAPDMRPRCTPTLAPTPRATVVHDHIGRMT